MNVTSQVEDRSRRRVTTMIRGEAVVRHEKLGFGAGTFLPSRLIGTRIANVPGLIGGQSRRS